MNNEQWTMDNGQKEWTMDGFAQNGQKEWTEGMDKADGQKEWTIWTDFLALKKWTVSLKTLCL